MGLALKVARVTPKVTRVTPEGYQGYPEGYQGYQGYHRKGVGQSWG